MKLLINLINTIILVNDVSPVQTANFQLYTATETMDLWYAHTSVHIHLKQLPVRTWQVDAKYLSKHSRQ